MTVVARQPSTAAGREPASSVGVPTGGSVLLATMLRGATTVGVTTHMTQVARLLDTRGHDAQVVAPTWPGRLSSTALLAPTTALRQVTGRELALRLERTARQRNLEHALRRRLRVTPCRLVYAQDPRSAAAALSVRRGAPVPVVMVVHFNDSQAQELVERGAIRAGGSYDRRIREFEADLLPRLDGLVYVSTYMREHLTAVVPAAGHLPSVVIPNFLEDDVATAPSPAPLRDCISVGTLGERKNHVYLLEVLAAGRRAGHAPTLTIVGKGPLRRELEARAEALGVGDQVVFTGPRSDVATLLRQHRVYVHSATIENLPYALLEAFRAGLPVVAGRVGGIGELLPDEKAGRFWPLDDPAAGARILNSLLNDPAALAEGSRTARRTFEERYSVASAGEELADFLLRTGVR